MTEKFCTVGKGHKICYRVYGEGEPVFLIAGLSLQLTYWPEAFISGLNSNGFQVIVFDNRDVGRSDRISSPPMGRFAMMFRRPPATNYDLGDMADDVVELMDHLNIENSHLVGISMGGMIGQTVAARYLDRVRTLTSIFSTTGASGVGQPSFTTSLRLIKRPAQTRQEAVEKYLNMLLHIAGNGYPIDEEHSYQYAQSAWDRGSPAPHYGISRQIAAIMKSGDRTEEIRKITAPTLVIHGDHDPLVNPSGGLATAKAIPNAKHVTIKNMRHYIAPGVIPQLLELIAKHTKESAI